MNESAENVKDVAADKYNQEGDYTSDVTQQTKDSASDAYEAGQEG